MEPDEQRAARDLPQIGTLAALLTALTPQRQKVAAYLADTEATGPADPRQQQPGQLRHRLGQRRHRGADAAAGDRRGLATGHGRVSARP
ncbi:hypothetical protein ACFWPH_22975 [Nocardia sp. NPDC058499]|uniref:hypothetical protein n=1 Tax=Nocardia sp. NPDC058499 TaxID=3346530 RepID=UPI0036474686